MLYREIVIFSSDIFMSDLIFKYYHTISILLFITIQFFCIIHPTLIRRISNYILFLFIIRTMLKRNVIFRLHIKMYVCVCILNLCKYTKNIYYILIRSYTKTYVMCANMCAYIYTHIIFTICMNKLKYIIIFCFLYFYF